MADRQKQISLNGDVLWQIGFKNLLHDGTKTYGLKKLDNNPQGAELTPLDDFPTIETVTEALDAKQDTLILDNSITMERAGVNMFNINDPDTLNNYFVNENGVLTAISGNRYGVTHYIPVEPGKTYTYTCDITGVSGLGDVDYMRIHFYNQNKEWVQQYYRYTATELKELDCHVTFTIPEGIYYVRCGRFMAGKNVKFEEGTKSTYYVAYGEEPPIVTGVSDTYTNKTVKDAVFADDTFKDIQFKAPKFQNPKVRYDKATFRVLDIGNSFTDDSVAYLSGNDGLAKYMETNKSLDFSNVSFTKAIRASASYKSWLNCYNDTDTMDYSITQVFGGLTETYTGTHGAGDGSMFRNLLKEHQFDQIIIHQVSTYSGRYDLWEGGGSSGYLKQFIRLIRQLQPQANIGFLLTHASPKQMAAGETDTQGQWQRIADSAKWIADNYDIDYVIPVGTAVENIRISRANTTSNHLTRDNHHMGDGLCRYTAACAYWEAVFAPYFGQSCYNSGWAYKEITGTAASNAGTIQVNGTNMITAQMSAMYAVTERYTVNNPTGKWIGRYNDLVRTTYELPSSTPLADENYDVYALTANDVLPDKFTDSGKVVAGWWSFSNQLAIKDIDLDNFPLDKNHSSDYLAIDKILPVGTVMELPEGVVIRPNYVNTCMSVCRRYDELGGSSDVIKVLGAEVSQANANAVQPNGVFVHFRFVDESDGKRQNITPEWIYNKLQQYPIVVKIPKVHI